MQDQLPNSGQLSIYCDGGARGNPGPAASAFIICASSGQLIHKQGFYLGPATNNQAEYTTVLKAYEWLFSQSSPLPQTIKFLLDSQLVVEQLSGRFKVKDPQLRLLYLHIKELEDKLKNISPQLLTISYHYIPRAENFQADLLVNQTLDSALI